MRTCDATLVLTAVLTAAACNTDPAPASRPGPVADAAPATALPPLTQCDNVPPVPEGLPGAETFIYSQTAARPLRIHVFKPAGDAPAHPAILFYFGGGWRTGTPQVFADRARRMAEIGYVAAVADYRVSCRDGSTPAESAVDASLSYQWLRAHVAELKVDRSRIILSGGSAGGHIAAAAAMTAPASQKPAALVLFNPVVDLVSIAPRIGLSAETAAALSPAALPALGAPPTIIFHGDADTTVPIRTVRDFCQRLRTSSVECKLVEYPGRGHGFFQSRETDAALGASPYDETLGRATGFLSELGLAP